MVWGSSTVNGAIPSGSKYLLGFNEPNFKAQSNLTPQAAATAVADAAGERDATRASLALVGPGDELLRPRRELQRHRPVRLPDGLPHRVHRTARSITSRCTGTTATFRR